MRRLLRRAGRSALIMVALAAFFGCGDQHAPRNGTTGARRTPGELGTAGLLAERVRPEGSSADGSATDGAPSGDRHGGRFAYLVQSVPAETTGIEAAGVQHTHDAWLEMVQGAERSLELCSFYISNHPGRRLEPILAAIEAASRRGVVVRILVDAAFAEKYPAELTRLRGSVAVRTLEVFKEGGGVQHAKYLIVDREQLYLGSANFDWRALEHIHEIGIRAFAPVMARQLASVFDLDWAAAAKSTSGAMAAARAVRPDGQAVWQPVWVGKQRLSLVASPKGWLPSTGAWDLPKIVQAIDGATQRISIQLLSYDAAYRDGKPWAELRDAIARAAGRGVAVRIALSHWQTSHMKAVVALQLIAGVDVVIVHIPEHSSGFVPFARTNHAKYMVVDGRLSWIGTSNWKADYFYLSRNVGVMIEGREFARKLESIFDGIFTGPYQESVDPTKTYQPARVGP